MTEYTLRHWTDRARGMCQFDGCQRAAARGLEYQTVGMQATRVWFLCLGHALTVRLPQPRPALQLVVA
jgi:hypothetical protein